MMKQVRNLRLILGLTDANQDDLLFVLLEDARLEILSHTNRRPEQWLPVFDSIQRKLAAVKYNQRGDEGAASKSEGGLSVSYSEGSPLNEINSYRLIR